jgi:putative oxidoreductase
MKNSILLIIALTAMTTSSCVQKKHKRTVTLLVDVSGNKAIKTVGVRGGDKPLSWDYDTPMEMVKKDSLYKITISGETGRLCTSIKFTVNGEFELKEKDNRKVYFAKKDTTVYKAKFDVLK